MDVIGNNALSSISPNLKKPVLIFGAGQVAEVFRAYLLTNRHDVASFIVDRQFLCDGEPHLRPANSFESVADLYSPSEHAFTVGMSFKRLNKPRAEKYLAMRAKGYEPFKFVDKRASWADSATVGMGSFVMDANVLQPRVSIGENCILWSGNHIGHHTRIGDHVFVASHVVIGGACEIGDYSFIGVNATIRDGVKIGARCVIGAGALILSDCADDGVYAPGGTERSKVPSHRLRGI